MPKRHYKPKTVHGYVIPKPRKAYKTTTGWLKSVYKANKEQIDSRLAGIADPQRAFIEGVKGYSRKNNLVERKKAEAQARKDAAEVRRSMQGKTVKAKTEKELAKERERLERKAELQADEQAVREQLSQVTYTSIDKRLRENALEGMRNASVMTPEGKRLSVREYFRRHNKDEKGRFRKLDESSISYDRETGMYELTAADGTNVRWKPRKNSPKEKKNKTEDYYVGSNKMLSIMDEGE